MKVEATRAGLPVVAIVGRPNVGKSTLFNRLVRARRAIVDDTPGVTRDRVVAGAEHAGRAFLCVDTGGFHAEATKDMPALVAQVRAQALAAVAEADVIVCVFDGPAGLLPADRELVRLVAKSGKPVLHAVNKIDHPGREGALLEFYALGVEPVLAVSSAHGRGIGELLDAVVAAMPAIEAASAATPGLRLAIMGRPNVGKSSILNRLLGAERAIVSPQAGTTRDAIDTPVTVGGTPYVLIDTAGIRRQGKVRDPLERHGAVRALGVLARSDLVAVVLDATEGMTDQDARIVGRAWEAGRGVVLLANKWDAVARPERDADRFQRHLRTTHPGFAQLPVLCVSAKSGEGLQRLFPIIARVGRAYAATLPTPALNRALKDALEATPPPSPGGRPLRFFYAAQTGHRPPEVVVFTSGGGAVPAAYARYLTSALRKSFDLVAVPLRVTFRSRRPPGSGRQGRRRRRATRRQERR